MRYLNVTLVPDRGGSVQTFRLQMRLFRGIFILAGIGALMMAGSGVVFLKALGVKQEFRKLKRENANLRQHLDGTEQRLLQVEDLVEQNESLEQQARLLAGLDPVDDETRLLGVGGPLLNGEPAPQTGDPALDGSLGGQSQRLEELLRRATFQQQSYDETLTSLQRQEERLRHTPTLSPLRGSYFVSSGFGWRADPFTGGRGFHGGLDMRASEGTPVQVPADGVVRHVGPDGEFGLTVRIDHGFGLATMYSHLSSARVRVGEKVVRGQSIATVGSSGRSTGPHLHYEVHANGVPKDPSAYVLMPRVIVD